MAIRILIADDNPLVRTALAKILSGAGREIVEAEDGGDAIAKALQLQPALVVLDLAMPVTDGLNAARQISTQLPNTPLFLYTMHSSPHLQFEAQKYGIKQVFSKSDSQALAAAVQQELSALPPPEIPAPPDAPLVLPPEVPLVLPPDALPTPAAIEAEIAAKPETPAVPAEVAPAPPAEPPEKA